MKIYFFTFIFFCSFSGLFSQSAFKQFKKLSRPEKCWVISHPCKAKKAMLVTKKVLAAVDSIKKEGTLGTDLNGGRLDAFKHAYWMAALALKIGSKKALKLGKAHEKGNYIEFKKHKLEDAILPDSVSSAMDLHNNENGIYELGNCKTFRSEKEVQQKIIHALENGKLRIIKKDRQGNYLYCDGTFIDTNEWAGKWNIPKCLIASGKD
jgi:hypothetical protein